MNTDSISESVSTAQAYYRIPASISQARIWDGREERGAAWNIAVRFLLQGDLSYAAFQGAVNAMAANHEVLRTTFSSDKGELYQVIHPSVQIGVTIFDLEGLTTKERENELERISKVEGSVEFEMEALPLLRVLLVKICGAEHVLLLTLHHSICDGWSIGVLSTELMNLYGLVLRNSGPETSERLQYADYSVWHAQLRESDDYRSHEAFWRQYLLPLISETPESESERPLYKPGSADSQIVSLVLPKSLTDGLHVMARKQGTTFFHVVLAAFEIMQLSENEGTGSIIGVPISGRGAEELETVVGPFVNYLPVRSRISTERMVGDYLLDVANEFSELLSHGDYRYEDMLRFEGAGRDLFTSAFICQRDFVREIAAGDVQLSAIPSISPGALVDKTFFLVEREDGWRASCEMNTSVFSVEEARQSLLSFEAVLRCIDRDVHQSVASILNQLSDLPKLSKPLREDSGSAHPMSEGLEAAEKSNLEFPASQAQTRYWLLDQSQAASGAFHLRIRLLIDGELNVECLVRAVEYLVERHEILRTTFRMTDDGLRQIVHEDARRYSFEQANTSAGTDANSALEALLSREDNWPFDLENGPILRVLLIGLSESKHVLAVTMPHMVGDGWSCGILQRELFAAYDAFLSFGQPQLPGIGIQYGDYAVHEQMWLRGDEAKQRVLFWRSYLGERLTALDLPVATDSAHTTKGHAGASSIVIDSSVAAAAKCLARQLDTTPFVVYGAVFQALLFRYSRSTDIVFSTPLASRTEESATTVGPFSVPIVLRSSVGPDWTAREFIMGLHNVAMDAFDNPLPFESYADSVSLGTSRGRHALNQICFFYQRAFVDSMEVAGLRLNPLPTGITGSGFEWQLSVIERSEGTYAELQYDAEAHSSESSRFVLEHYSRLLAQFVKAPDMAVTSLPIAGPEEIEAAERGDKLLLVSRRVLGFDLPAPGSHRTRSPEVDRLAETEAEARMATIWERVFRRSSLSVHSDFFELGGHSLMLARLQSLIEREYGVRIGAADVFLAPTIASLAMRLDNKALREAQHPRVVPIQSGGSQTPLFLISQSMVFRRMAEWLGADQPVLTIQMQNEDISHAGTNTTFETIAAFYVDVIRAVRPEGPYRIGGWCMSGWIAYEVARQLQERGELVELLMIVDAWAPGYWRDMSGKRRIVAKSEYYLSRLGLHLRSLATLTNRKRLEYVRERFRLWRAALSRQLASGLSLAGLSIGLTLEEQTTYVDQVVFAASRKYRAREWKGKVLIFRSSEQPEGRYLASDMGWNDLLQADVSVTTLPGDHREIFEDPGARIIAEKILDTCSPGGAVPSQTESSSHRSRTTASYTASASCAIVTR